MALESRDARPPAATEGPMFERITPSEEQKDAEAAEGRSADKIAGLRLAALVILANTALTILLVILIPEMHVPFIPILVSVFLVYYLWKLRPRAEGLALALAILGAAVGLFSVVTRGFSTWALIGLVPTAGLVGSQLLLLIGDPPRSRRIAAVALFAVLVGGFTAMTLLERFRN